jgi:hypothetical protein
MESGLPTELPLGATVRGNEYGWSISAFPNAIAVAKQYGFACLAGQFQFRQDDGSTCEMDWLAADSADRTPGELWAEYSRRSCDEVLKGFLQLVSVTDFRG